MSKLDFTRTAEIKNAGGAFDRLKANGFIWTRDYVIASLFAGAGVVGAWFDPSDKLPMGWRRNLLSWNEDLSWSGWTKQVDTTISSKTVTGLNGPNTADRVVVSAPAADRRFLLNQNIGYNLTPGETYTLSGYFVVDDGMPVIALGFAAGSAQFGWSAFDTVTNAFIGSYVLSTVGVFTFVSCVNVTGNIWRLVINFNPINGGIASVRVQAGVGTAAELRDGASAGSFGLFGLQLEKGYVATDVQPMTTGWEEAVALNPNTTLYQEGVGLTPASEPGEVVGMILDKAKGLKRGPELVPALDFTSGWLFTGTAVVFTGPNTYTSPATANVYRQLLAIGKTYEIDIKASFTSAALTLFNSFTGNNVIKGLFSGARQRLIYTAVATEFNIRPTNAGNVVVEYLSIREIEGYHANQLVNAARPVLARQPKGGRRNLIVKNTKWLITAAGVTVTQVASPTGEPAIRMVGVGARNFATLIPSTQAVANGQSLTLWFTVDATTPGIILQQIAPLSSFGVTTAPSGVTGNLSNSEVTPGTYKIVYTNSTGAEVLIDSISSAIRRFGFGTVNVLTADITISRIQLEEGNSMTAHQRVASQYDVTEVGKEDTWFLWGDGVDDVLVTRPVPGGVQSNFWMSMAVAHPVYTGSTSYFYQMYIGGGTTVRGLSVRYQGPTIRIGRSYYRKSGGTPIAPSTITNGLPTAGVPMILDSYDDVATIYYSVNGGPDLIGPMPDGGTTADAPLAIGGAGPQWQFFGGLFRVGAPTPEERQKVATYLDWKCGALAA